MFNPVRFTLLAFIALSLNAQNSGSIANVHHLMGLEKVPRNAQGTVVVEKDALQFASKKGDASVPVKSIDDIYTGAEVTQSGGTMGTITKVALPYGGGRALSLILRNKIDVLTITYRDSDGGFHGFIATMPKGKGDELRTQLTSAGAHVSPPAEFKERSQAKQDKPAPAAAEPKEDPKKLPKLSATAIRVEQIDAGEVLIPMEFRVAIYESLLERVRATGKFQQVYRSGDRRADGVAGLVTLHTRIDRFQEGSRTKREVTTVAGATKVEVLATVEGKDGNSMLSQNLTGKVRFFGDNLGVTNDLAKRISKLLSERF